jgi:hypothetical protein
MMKWIEVSEKYVDEVICISGCSPMVHEKDWAVA